MNESKTDDVVWRLRERIGIPGRFGYSPDCQLLADAANEIERLRSSAPQGDGRALEKCDWPNEPFTFRDEPGEHNPCYVVMPGGAMLALNHHAGGGVDIARAKFIVAACNAAPTGEAARWFAVAQTEAAGRERMSQLAASRLSAPPSVALEARDEIAKIEIIVKLAVGDGEYIGRHCSSMIPKDVIDLRDRATAERLTAVRAALTRPQPGGAS